MARVKLKHWKALKESKQKKARKYNDIKKLENKTILRCFKQEINNNVRSIEENLEKKMNAHLKNDNKSGVGVQIW